MDLKQLNYIVAIADEQNLSKAAQKLYVSQPALSLSLSRLEESLGLKLFERQKSAMILTPAGERYVDTARRMLAMKDELYQELAQMAGAKASVLEIGIVPMTCGPMFTAVYPLYKELEPTVSIRISENPARVLEQLLQDKKLRLAFLTYLPSAMETNLVYQTLRSEAFFLGICRDHPLAKEPVEPPSGNRPGTGNPDTPAASVSVLRFKELPFILSPRGTNRRRLEDETFRQAGFTPQISCEINSMATVRRMVAAGEGVAFFAEGYTQQTGAVRYFPIDTAPRWSIGAAHLKSVRLAPHEKQFLRLAQEYYRTHGSYL